MSQTLLKLLVSSLLLISCTEKEIQKYYSETVSTGTSSRQPDHWLLEQDIEVSLNQSSGTVEIKVTPTEKVQAKWRMLYSKAYQADVPSSGHKVECSVDHKTFLKFERVEAFIENLYSPIEVLINGEVMKNSEHFRFLEVNNSILLYIDQDHFTAKSITLRNKTVREIFQRQNDLSLCLNLPILKDMPPYEGKKIDRNEYVIFSITTL